MSKQFCIILSFKTTTGTKGFVSVIANIPALAKLVITKVDDYVKIRLALHLINRISRVLQKLLKYFNGIIILTSFVLTPVGVFSVILF